MDFWHREHAFRLESPSACLMQFIYFFVASGVMFITNFAIVYDHYRFIGIMVAMNSILTVLRLFHRESNIAFMTWLFFPFVYYICYPYITTGVGDFNVTYAMAIITYLYVSELIPLAVALFLHIQKNFCAFHSTSHDDKDKEKQGEKDKQKKEDDGATKEGETGEGPPNSTTYALTRTLSITITKYDKAATEEEDPAKGKGKEKEKKVEKKPKAKSPGGEHGNSYLIPLYMYQFTFEYHVEVLIAIMILAPQLLVLLGLIVLEWIAGFHSAFMFSSNYLSGIATSLSQISIGKKKLVDKVIPLPQKKDEVDKGKQPTKGDVQITVVK